MKKIAFIILVLAGFSAGAQTKKVAHRSHSGRDAGFSINGIDNFGETPEMREHWNKQREERQKNEDKEQQKMKEDSARRADSIAKQEKHHKKDDKKRAKDSLKKNKELKEKGKYQNPNNMDKQNAFALVSPSDGGSGFPPAASLILIGLGTLAILALFALKQVLQKRLLSGV